MAGSSRTLPVSHSPVSPVSNIKRKFEPQSDVEFAKRLKASEPDFRTHSQLWALDGNVLLQMDSTRFKLHQSRLAVQSPWFEKLFKRRVISKADPGDESDGNSVDVLDEDVDIQNILSAVQVVDECDLYFLSSSQVTLKDFVCLLSAMDNSIGFQHQHPDFPIVASIYRAAKTFNFPKFLDYAKKCIRSQFTNFLKDVTTKKCDFAVEAILLGRRWDLPFILKRAFYELARGDSRDDEDSDDGNDKEGSDEEEIDIVETIKAVEGIQNSRRGDRYSLRRLDPADLVRLLKAQKQLTTAWHQALSFDKPECSKGKAKCAINNARTHWNVIHGSGLIDKYELDPICGIRALYKISWEVQGYCESCSAGIMDRLRAQEKRIWKDLDDWFDLCSV